MGQSPFPTEPFCQPSVKVLTNSSILTAHLMLLQHGSIVCFRGCFRVRVKGPCLTQCVQGWEPDKGFQDARRVFTQLSCIPSPTPQVYLSYGYAWLPSMLRSSLCLSLPPAPSHTCNLPHCTSPTTLSNTLSALQTVKAGVGVWVK